MKKQLLLSTMLVAIATAATAADLPVKAPPPAAPIGKQPILDTWTGPYLGVHVGWGQYDAKDKSFLPLVIPAYDGKFDGDGWLAGVQAGYDHQWGNFVLGFALDYSWSGMDGEKTIGGLGGLSVKHEMESFGTARLRAGLAWNQFLLYATGGAAYAKTKASLASVVNAKTDRVGWTYGVGAEWKVTPNWSFGVEWLHLDFGTKDMSFGIGGGTPVALTTPIELDADIIRANFNYRF